MRQESQVFVLKSPTTDSLTDSFALNSSAGAASQKAPGTYREELNCLAMVLIN